MTLVAVKPELIQWARERSGLDIASLRKLFPKYELWESGQAKPTLRQLETLAKRTYTPFGHFFLPEPPEDTLPIPDFRTLDDAAVSRPSPNLLETIQTMQRRQAWMREFLIDEGQEPLKFVGSVTRRQRPESVAPKIRKVLGLRPEWARSQSNWEKSLGTLRDRIENAGILVVHNGVVGNATRRKLDEKEFRGFILLDEYAPLIFVNASDAKAAQMFTLVHELAHLWLGRGGVVNFRKMMPAENDVEQFCNRVAAEFLVPEEEFEVEWTNARNSSDPFQMLARVFKVSPLVVARRALDLRFISRETFFAFYDDYLENLRRMKKEKPGGGDFYANQNVRVGKRFAQAVMHSAKEGRLLFRDAYALTGLNGKTFNRYAETLGIRP